MVNSLSPWRMANHEYNCIRIPKPLIRLSQNLCLARWLRRRYTHMPKFKSITPVGVSWQIGKISFSRRFFSFRFMTPSFARILRLNHRTSAWITGGRGKFPPLRLSVPWRKCLICVPPLICVPHYFFLNSSTAHNRFLCWLIPENDNKRDK